MPIKFAPVFSKVFSNTNDHPQTGETVDKDGCPLEDHPNWNLVSWHSTGDSYFCWGNYGRDIIVRTNTTPVIGGLGYRNISADTGQLSCEVKYVFTSTETFLMLAKMVDADNIIGVTISNSKYEVRKKHTGTWTSEHTSTNDAAIDDEIKIHVIGGRFYFYINDVEEYAADIETELNGTGEWGIYQDTQTENNITVASNYSYLAINSVEEGYPLEKLDSWTLLSWTAGPSNLGWDDWGNIVTASDNSDTHFLSYGNKTGINGYCECELEYLSPNADKTLFMAVRMIDANNYVGVATANNRLELYEVVSGTETLLGTTTSIATGQTVRLRINASTVTVSVNGTIEITATTSLAQNTGYFGIVERAFDAPDS